MISEEISKSGYVCHTCDKDVAANEDTGDLDYWFYQVKHMGDTKYMIDYAFCSKACMVKYTKKKENNQQK